MTLIDKAVEALYGNKKYGELSSLYKLFDNTVSEAISSQLSTDLNLRNSPLAFDKIYVDLQWIDKIPLASFITPQKDLNGHKITSKTEIGDLFIQYRHTNAFDVDGDKEIHPYCHRALVVQAKLASEDKPVVPIGYVNKNSFNSTTKELKLLEDWPDFDMYETSRSGQPVAKNLSVKASNIPFSFYGGFSNKSKSWFFGKAKNAQVCKKSFSDIIVELAKNNSGKDVSNDPAWKTITLEITKTCRNRNMPPLIAGKVESRNKSKLINSGVVYSFPAPFVYLFQRGWARFMSLFRNKKMLVITIDRVSYEGTNMEQYR
jgi:hypothetical protein